MELQPTLTDVRSLIKDVMEMLEPLARAIAVFDTGIGIAPEDQASIFEPYVRVGYTNKPQLPDSTGLGLAIVARLVKILQGRIELISQVGVGSTFTVTLPLAVRSEG